MHNLIRRKSLILATFAARLTITLPIALTAVKHLTAAAYHERGYSAVGGEWLAIGLIVAAVWALTGYIARLLLGIKK